MTELHLHLDGSLRPATCFDLYNLQRTPCPAKNVGEMEKLLRADPKKNLKEMVDFSIATAVLQQNQALERVAFELVSDLADEGVTYAEIRFAPQLSVHQGMSQLEVVEAVQSGVSRAMAAKPIKVGLILCLMRGGKEGDNFETIEVARRLIGTNVCGLDIAGPEKEYPLRNYVNEFLLAKTYGIPYTLHAGEEDCPDDINIALQLGAKRLGHATCLLKYPSLFETVKKNHVLIECCVTSNFVTHQIARLDEHPIKKLFEAGIPVCVCADDRTMLDTTLGKEEKLVRDVFGFTYDDIMKMEAYADEFRFLKK
jgi:adenosine deaminase